jgi:hypothetical protein
MVLHRGGIGEAGHAFSHERPSAVCLRGRVGHGHHDRGCESSQLTITGSDRLLRRNPAMVAPWRAFFSTLTSCVAIDVGIV